MNLRVIGAFLLGRAAAIQKVATDRAALWTGIGLVLLTGMARNYDQSYFLASPMWLIGPLAFSFFSGSFLYGILIRGLGRRHYPETLRNEKRWATFMALFWMTAPVAWIYAIPVERFLDSYPTAQANLGLLAIVSTWRVLLMGRVLSVLLKIHFLRAVGWVLIAASLEVILVLFLGIFFTGRFSRAILAGMAGMRNSPEQYLITEVLGRAWAWSWLVLLGSIILLSAKPLRKEIQPLPESAPGKMPWFLLAALFLIWSLVAIQPQREQHNFTTHARLVARDDYSGALAFLEKHRQADFPPGRRLEPNPYEYRVWEGLPPTIAELKPETAPWIRQVYLNHLTATLSHHYSGYRSLTNLAAMWFAIERLPEGRDWVLSNQVALANQGLISRYSRSESEGELTLQTNILNALSRMGMNETNLKQLIK